MKAICKVNYTRTPIPLSLRPQPPFLTRFSSLSFRNPPPPYSISSIKATSSSNPLLPKLQNPKSPIFETLNQFPSSLIRTTLIAAVTATALFFTRFKLKPLIAAPIYPPATVETAADDEVNVEEKERSVEEYLNLNPNDVESLRVLVSLKVRNRKIKEAIPVIEKLMSLEPNNLDLPVTKAHMHMFAGEHKLAKLGFEQVLSKDPFCIEAYHGLVLAASETDSGMELKEIARRIQEEIEKCKKEKKKKKDLREFKLLLAEIQVIEGVYDDALKIYEEVVKEEPRDFRAHLGKGIVYTLLSKREEAEKCFDKYRRIVPKGHPFAKYFDYNMMDKLFSQKVDLNTEVKMVENERGDSKTELEVVEDERDSSKNEEQVVEDERDSSKIEEQVVEDERDSSKKEEKMVEEERASSSSESAEEMVRSG